MTRPKHCTADRRPSTYSVMSDLWRRWRKKTDIDNWHFAAHLVESSGVTLNSREYIFTELNFTAGIVPSNIELSRQTFNNVADSITHTLQHGMLNGNVLLVRDIVQPDQPTAPYHTDDVYKWEGFPVRIRTRPNGNHIQFHFSFFLGIIP